MKHVFVILFALCVLWSVGVYFLNPTHESDLPIMHWVTDRNPVRQEQISRFHEWMKENGYPEVELRLDTSNADNSKKIIQGVSGVGSDLIDLPSDQIRFFASMGLLEDVTDAAAELGFDASHTYKALKDVLLVDGRQYAFPANIDITGLIINRDQFDKVGVTPPNGHWTLEEFEKAGLEYVRKANAGLPRQLFFFSSPIGDRPAFLRSYGADLLNETLTAPTINTPEYSKSLATLKRWIDLGITPSSADVQSMATDTGYGGANFQLFNTGNYAMVQVGRHAVILLRQVGNTNLSVVPPPADTFPNVTIRTRAVAAYKGSRHPELTPYFLAYLASDAYNETVVDSGDALPPSPEIALTENYHTPAGFENEWDFHKHFADYANNMAISMAVSPYILPSVLGRVERDAHDSVMANLRTPEQAAELAQVEVQREIDLTLREHALLREDYDIWIKNQAEVDRLKAAGEKIPAKLIRNPFHLAYYRHLGILDETPEPEAEVKPAADKSSDKASAAGNAASKASSGAVPSSAAVGVSGKTSFFADGISSAAFLTTFVSLPKAD